MFSLWEFLWSLSLLSVALAYKVNHPRILGSDKTARDIIRAMTIAIGISSCSILPSSADSKQLNLPIAEMKQIVRDDINVRQALITADFTRGSALI
jgi:hypothetical protein